MLYYEKDGKHNRVTVPRKFVEEVFTFIKKRELDYCYYVQTREADFEQCKRQDWQAKTSEYALSRFLTDYLKLPFVQPDMQYYDVKDKSYEPDLVYNDVTLFGNFYKRLNLHCKSCDVRTKEDCSHSGYSGESYAFCHDVTKKNSGVDRLFTKGDKSDWVGCVYIPFEGAQRTAVELYIRAIIPWNFIRDNDLWMASKKNKFRAVKKFLYAEKLQESVC